MIGYLKIMSFYQINLLLEPDEITSFDEARLQMFF
jgi:hypothetical protein